MTHLSRNRKSQFSHDRNLKLEALERRDLMTVGTVMAATMPEFAAPAEERVTIGHEKNIASRTAGQCQGACYVRHQGAGKLEIYNGFFTQHGSASELRQMTPSDGLMAQLAKPGDHDWLADVLSIYNGF